MNQTFLLQTALFHGCLEDDLPALARHLAFRTVSYPKGAVILREGSLITDIGLILEGCVQMEHNDIWGNKSIWASYKPGVFLRKHTPVFPAKP